MDHKKAQKFIDDAAKHGWESKSEVRGNETHVISTRGGEQIHIWWVGNALTSSPQYSYMGRTVGTHNTAGAYRRLEGKPSVIKHTRKSARRQRVDPTFVKLQVEEEGAVRHELPFDLDESPKSEILKCIRGNNISWFNSRTGVVETCLVPYKVSGKNGVRLFNVDLKNVFYIKANNSGRRYVSFMDGNGTFRAVYLDAILQVA